MKEPPFMNAARSGRRKHLRTAVTATALAAALCGAGTLPGHAAGPAGSAAPAPASAAAYPDPRPVTGDTEVHDPSAVRLADGSYVVYSTHDKIEARVSQDGRTWRRAGSAFTEIPDWWRAYSPEGDPWAPEVTYRGGVHWLYYAVSSFGSNHSAIGLATSVSGRPGTWQDRGVVFATTTSDHYNAIDPAVIEADGKVWMSFGSYWTGIRMIELDRRTGKPATDDPEVLHLATRPDEPYAVEAPYIVKHRGQYYLFVSYDRCCAGTESTYNIRVGRATSPTGPYYDRDGTPMTEGGGELLLAGHGRYVGTGGQSVLRDRGRDVLVYHYYDAADEGRPKLGLNALTWGKDGWPAVSR
jgi:arabinan endo-1,5-alpha-L-arabinosidase